MQQLLVLLGFVKVMSSNGTEYKGKTISIDQMLKIVNDTHILKQKITTKADKVKNALVFLTNAIPIGFRFPMR